jgi:hypothetical protein
MSTCVLICLLICLVLLMDGFPSIFLYRVFLLSLLLDPINLHNIAKSWHLTQKKKKKNLFTCRTRYWIHGSYTVLSRATAYPEKEEREKSGLRQKQTNAPHADCCEACWHFSRAKFNHKLEKISCRSTGRSAASKDQLHQKCAQNYVKLLKKVSPKTLHPSSTTAFACFHG